MSQNNSTDSASSTQSFAAPRFVVTWVGLILWRLLSQLPLPLLYVLGSGLGQLLYFLLGDRRRVTRTNIDLCFPEFSETRRRKIVGQCFRRAGQSLFDIGVAAWSPSTRLERLVEVEGLEKLEDLHREQLNVIILAPHFVCVGACALYLAQRLPVFAIYKPPKNPLFAAAYRRATAAEASGHGFLDWLMEPRHDKGNLSLIEHRGPMKPMVRKLRDGDMLYYPSDQSLGNRQTVIAPFFGIDTATISAASRLTRLGRAVVVPGALFQKAYGQGYRLVIHDPIKFDGEIDEIEETTQLNRAIERLVHLHPDQYFWLHKRFKPIDENSISVYKRNK